MSALGLNPRSWCSRTACGQVMLSARRRSFFASRSAKFRARWLVGELEYRTTRRSDRRPRGDRVFSSTRSNPDHLRMTKTEVRQWGDSRGVAENVRSKVPMLISCFHERVDRLQVCEQLVRWSCSLSFLALVLNGKDHPTGHNVAAGKSAHFIHTGHSSAWLLWVRHLPLLFLFQGQRTMGESYARNTCRSGRPRGHDQ